VTTMEYAWTQQVAAPADLLPQDPRSLAGMMANLADQHEMRADDSLAELLTAFEEQNTKTLRVFAEADLDATVDVPDHIRAIYIDPGDWTVRWVVLHLIEELTRHAGHADIIRESIDGATMYELLAALEGW
jgi:hypothetical protein